MNPPVGLVNQGPQNQQGPVPMLAANSNLQPQLNTFLGNVSNTLNQPPFMPGTSFSNGPNIAAYNALMMQNGILGIQNMQCQPPNFNTVSGLPFQGQFYNAAQNFNQIAGQQFQGQLNLQGQGLWPQSFPPNMNQIMCLLQAQMNAQNTVAPMNNILPQQCPTNPFGSAQSTPSNNHIFSQCMTLSPYPSNCLFSANATQVQAIDRQRSASTISQNSQPQFADSSQLHQNGKNIQMGQIPTEKSDEILNAKLGSERQTFTSSPVGNWKRGNSQTRFLKPRPHHLTNGRGSMRTFDQNRGDGQRNGKERKPNNVTFDNQNREPRRCLSVSYTEEEVRQWREARRKHYPTASKIDKKLRQSSTNLAANDEDAEARRKQLRDILAKQAELGVEVAEVPRNYLADPESSHCNREHTNHYRERGKPYNRRGRFPNKFNKRGRADCDNRYIQRQKPLNGEFPAPVVKRAPTLLQKLLSSEIKEDKSKLLQVFRFITLNSFFEHWPEKTLVFPQVTSKDAPFDGDTDMGACSGSNNGFDTFKAGTTNGSISDIKQLTEANVADDVNSDEDIDSGNSSEDDDCELSAKSEEGEI